VGAHTRSHWPHGILYRGWTRAMGSIDGRNCVTHGADMERLERHCDAFTIRSHARMHRSSLRKNGLTNSSSLKMHLSVSFLALESAYNPRSYLLNTFAIPDSRHRSGVLVPASGGDFTQKLVLIVLSTSLYYSDSVRRTFPTSQPPEFVPATPPSKHTRLL
jgi:hypothetical protein